MGSSKHVLVIEDDQAIRDLLRDALSEAAYTVATASTGTGAIEAMHQHLPDLLLLDLMMPDMNGWQLLHRVAQSPDLAAVPILVVSAASAHGLRDAQELGAPVFVPKPFDLDDLLREVKRLTTTPARQCAWCGQVATSNGEFALHSGRSLSWATHGVCPSCKRDQMRRIIEQSE